jgi:hypothetical protein
MVFTSIFVYETWTQSDTRDTVRYYSLTILLVGLGVLFNILSDYASLFFVRYFVTIARSKPAIAMLIGSICGMFVVFVFISFRANLVLRVGVSSFYPDETDTPIYGLLDATFNSGLLFAPLAVHLWLPLFALAVALLRTLNYFRFAVGKTQEFLKRGREHPLEAIGYVAAIIVFCTTVMGKVLFAVL